MDGLNFTIEYWHWIIFGLLLSVSEIFVLSFVLLWFGLSAIAVGLLLLVMEIPLTIQILLWIFLSAFNVFAWFKWISPRLKNKTLSGMSREKMLGQVGTVIEFNPIHEGRGTLRFPAPILGADEWQFICEDALEVGTRVVVKEFSGNSLIVNKMK
ncbi:MAG: NfeD family protein [Methyloprofundus sp.]|nr:NfeD family protein [Methyloprofundus sp.]